MRNARKAYTIRVFSSYVNEAERYLEKKERGMAAYETKQASLAHEQIRAWMGRCGEILPDNIGELADLEKRHDWLLKYFPESE